MTTVHVADGVWWRPHPGHKPKIHAHVDGGQYAWIAKITGPSDQFIFERRFLAHTEFGQADARDFPVYEGEVIEAVVQNENLRKYFKRDGNGGWEEIPERTVKEIFSGPPRQDPDRYRCWDCDMVYYEVDMTEREPYGYVCDDCDGDDTEQHGVAPTNPFPRN